MFDAQVVELRSDYRCIAYDLRGHGKSGVPKAGYDLDTQTADAVVLIRALAAMPCHFVGVSLGGVVGLHLAADHPQLIRSLTLIGSTAGTETHSLRLRLASPMVRWLGPGLFARTFMKTLFGSRFLRDPAQADLREEWRTRIAANDRRGLARSMTAVAKRPPFDRLSKVAQRTLLIVGEEDRANPPKESETMKEQLHQAKLAVIPKAGHSPTIEAPEAATGALRLFLSGGALSLVRSEATR